MLARDTQSHEDQVAAAIHELGKDKHADHPPVDALRPNGGNVVTMEEEVGHQDGEQSPVVHEVQQEVGESDRWVRVVVDKETFQRPSAEVRHS